MMFGSLFYWLSDGYLPAGFKIRSVDDLRIMFTVYGFAWMTLGATIMALYGQGWRRADQIGLDRNERIKTAGEIASWSLALVTGALSLLLVAIIEWDNRANGWMFAWPGIIYSLMGLSYPVAKFAEQRVARRLPA
jgi:hypothetical protein